MTDSWQWHSVVQFIQKTTNSSISYFVRFQILLKLVFYLQDSRSSGILSHSRGHRELYIFLNVVCMWVCVWKHDKILFMSWATSTTTHSLTRFKGKLLRDSLTVSYCQHRFILERFFTAKVSLFARALVELHDEVIRKLRVTYTIATGLEIVGLSLEGHVFFLRGTTLVCQYEKQCSYAAMSQCDVRTWPLPVAGESTTGERRRRKILRRQGHSTSLHFIY